MPFNLQLRPPQGNTALHFALSYSRMDIVQVVLDTGLAEVDKANKVGNTAILISALAVEPTKFNLEVLQKLFTVGNVNVTAYGVRCPRLNYK